MKFKVHLSPGKKEFKIKEMNEFRDALQVDVSSPAQDGKANEELIEKLSEFFQSEVKLIAGKTSRDKFLEIDIDQKEFLKKIKQQ